MNAQALPAVADHLDRLADFERLGIIAFELPTSFQSVASLRRKIWDQGTGLLSTAKAAMRSLPPDHRESYTQRFKQTEMLIDAAQADALERIADAERERNRKRPVASGILELAPRVLLAGQFDLV